MKIHDLNEKKQDWEPWITYKDLIHFFVYSTSQRL